MNLRPATPADAAALADLGRASFCDAFAHLYREEDLSTFLDKAYSVEAVAAEIADPGVTHCLVEDRQTGALAAYCKLRFPSSYAAHSALERPLELGQLYCLAVHTGKGLGARLMDWALDQARAGGHDGLLLSVWAENFGAQKFYQRYGFAKIADIDFWVGQQRDDELLYELRLQAR